jgi:hypothetical protein
MHQSGFYAPSTSGGFLPLVDFAPFEHIVALISIAKPIYFRLAYSSPLPHTVASQS